MRLPDSGKSGVWIAGAVALLLSQSSLPFLCCAEPQPFECDSAWLEEPALLQVEAEVTGDHPLVRQLNLPQGVTAEILAIEKGIDVTLTLNMEGQALRADSPLHSFGVQRVIVVSGPGELTLNVASKEDKAASGAVVIRVVTLPNSRDLQKCVAIHRQLAAAEAAYAQGWIIRSGIDNAGAGAAESYFDVGMESYQHALRQFGRHPASRLQAAVMLSVASLYYWGPGNWTESQAWAQRAASAYEVLGEEYMLFRAQTLRAAALIEVDPAAVPEGLSLATQLLRRTSAGHAARGEQKEQADALNYLGISLYLAGAYKEATEAYSAALELFRNTGEQNRQWQVMDNTALIYREMGLLDKARGVYSELLKQGDLKLRPALHANVLANSALVLLEVGEAGQALDAYQLAYGTAEAIQDDYYKALTMQGIGSAYEALGDPDMALLYYGRALALRPREKGVRYRVETLCTMADVQRRRGSPADALALDQEALLLVDNDLDRARVRLRVAKDVEALGRLEAALDELAPVLSDRMPGDSIVHARALLLRGRIQAVRGNWELAGKDLSRSLSEFEKLGLISDQFEMRIAAAELRRRMRDISGAIGEVDAAIRLAEHLRLQSANPGLRASVLEALRPAFDMKIDLLAVRQATTRSPQARAALALEALQVAERARARSLQEYGQMQVDGTAVGGALWTRRRELYAQLSAQQLRLDSGSTSLSADSKLLATLREQIGDTRRAIDQVEGQLATKDSGQVLAANLDLNLNALPLGFSLVEYWLGARQAYAWIATRGELEMVSLGPSEPITDAALAVQRIMRDATADAGLRIEHLRALGNLIWEPIRRQIPSGGTVVFVPDMALHYVPFAALLEDSSRDRFLIQGRYVATAPSLRLLLAAPGEPAVSTDRILIVADPDYGEGVPRLKGSAREADDIAAISRRVAADRLQGRQATREGILASRLQDYRFIHIASHAVADARIPQLSYLQMASVDSGGHQVDGRMLAADFLGVRLNADLVVLSACDTSLGRVISGEGVIGLRYVLLARGAHAVAASLWRVGDRHTREFMAKFYTGLFRDEDAPAAMAIAMRDAIARHGNDPAVWAAFDVAVRDLGAVL